MSEKDVRAELRELSTLILGGPNRWRKLLDKGFKEDINTEPQVLRHKVLHYPQRQRHYTKETLLTYLRSLKPATETSAPSVQA